LDNLFSTHPSTENRVAALQRWLVKWMSTDLALGDLHRGRARPLGVAQQMSLPFDHGGGGFQFVGLAMSWLK
jgi:hypothetical protein